jgi:hypothetical protein
VHEREAQQQARGEARGGLTKTHGSATVEDSQIHFSRV